MLQSDRAHLRVCLHAFDTLATVFACTLLSQHIALPSSLLVWTRDCHHRGCTGNCSIVFLRSFMGTRLRNPHPQLVSCKHTVDCTYMTGSFFFCACALTRSRRCLRDARVRARVRGSRGRRARVLCGRPVVDAQVAAHAALDGRKVELHRGTAQVGHT